jgi:hypothetical protein
MGLVALTIVACAQAAPLGDWQLEQEFPHAFAKRGCTQEDAPALEIYFTKISFKGAGAPTPPYIRFEISSSPGEKIESIYLKLIQLHRDPKRPGRIARAELVETGIVSTWLSGTITLTEATPGERVTGHFDITTPNGRRWVGSFIAEYSKSPSVCG